MDTSDKHIIETLIRQHYDYLEKNNFQGWDVFDGLNSKILRATPLYNSRIIRLIWIQLFKRSPLNLRPFLFVPKDDNPKALALFISGILRLYALTAEEQYQQTAIRLYHRLNEFKQKTENGAAWGYNFPWQARAFYVPAFKPNMIASVFAGHALLDLFGVTANGAFLDESVQVGEFILGDLKLLEDKKNICFAYIPGEKVVVHNANLLGAAYLARLYALTDDSKFKKNAEKSVRYSADAQRIDGAWVYGERGHHQWVDNFHTGYNLVAIHQYQKFTSDEQFASILHKGLDFHLKHHFTSDFLPKYTDRSLYPLDIHCFSQAILTFIELKEYLPDYQVFLSRIIQNAFTLFYDEHKKYYYYQKTKYLTFKIPYIRWSQAWMFYSLTLWLKENEKK